MKKQRRLKKGIRQALIYIDLILIGISIISIEALLNNILLLFGILTSIILLSYIIYNNSEFLDL